MLGVERFTGRQWQQLVLHRALRHGVDEVVVAQEHAVDIAGFETVQHDLDHANQLFDMRLFAQMGDRSQHVDFQAAEEGSGLLADAYQIDFDALVLPDTHIGQDPAEHLRVQAATQAAVGRYDDVTDALDILALDHERMHIVRTRFGHVTDDLTHHTRVRTRCLHAVLGLADFRG